MTNSRTMGRKPFLACVLGVIALVLAIGCQLSLPKPPRQDHSRIEIALDDPKAVLGRFAKTLMFNTTSASTAENHVLNPLEFEAMHRHFRSSWPQVFESLEVTQVAKHSLLLKWQGTDASKKPILFISHQDVVAVGADDHWTHPAFGGVIADGYVWGRGALDVKVTMTAMFEAVAFLLKQRHRPERTLYLAFGHDEEVSGRFGAMQMAQMLTQQEVQLEFVMDEGGTVLTDGLKGLVEEPLALVGTAEKTTRDVTLEVRGPGGHSMMPPSTTLSAVPRLGRIINQIESERLTPQLVHPTDQLLKGLAAVTAKKNKVLGFLLQNADVWPISKVMAQILYSRGAELQASTITAHVINSLQSSPPGHNIVPSVASVNINFRVLPGQDFKKLLQRIGKIANQNSEGGPITLTVVDRGEANSEYAGNRVASMSNLGYKSLLRAAAETVQGPAGLTVAPYLMLGRTDSSHYIHLCDGNVFRFMPFETNKTAGDLQGIHGIDERVSSQTYLQGVQFYIRMMELSTTE